MRFLKAANRISFLFLFCFITRFAVAQNGGTFSKYENDKYKISFSYPGEYLLEKINDDEWVIHKADNSWVLMFKIMHLQGKSYNSYVNSLSTNIIDTYFKELSAKFGTPEKGAYRQSLIGGFEFDLFSSQYLASGTVMEKLTNSMIVYLNIFRKTSHAGFIPDGIIIYTLGPTINFDNSKLTTQFINTFEKTVVFKEAIVTKPLVTTVAKKKPVVTTVAKKKPVVTAVSKKEPIVTTPVVKKPATGKLTDTRDGGETYHTVMIGSQNWMAENLQVKTFRNGDAILNATTAKEWEKAGQENIPAWCYYNFDSRNEDYGKLYNWFAVKDVRGLATRGWHVPAEKEWAKLVAVLGGEKEALIKMRTAKGWSVNTEGSNASGFGALPGGCCTYGGTFGAITNIGYWWSSSLYPNSNSGAYSFIIVYNTALKTWSIETLSMDKSSGYSVRCVQD